MNRERYLERAMHEVLGPDDRVGRFVADLRNHFEEGAERGETYEQVAARLGSPEEVAAAFMENVELRPAGLWARTFAFLADLGLCLAACLPFAAAMILWGEALPDPGPAFVAAAVLVGISLTGVFLLYFPLFEGRFGWTPGKLLIGLRVRSEALGPITFGQAFLRRLSFYFELLVVDALFVPFTKRKQRAFDLVAKTVVVWHPDADRAAWRWLACLAPWVVAVVAALALSLPEILRAP
ncbi:MAG TPA: RDD family protein [Thermoanaerobaculia bacterium]|nr:RDD family protein [Thermoanaerobaculia bacterium]